MLESPQQHNFLGFLSITISSLTAIHRRYSGLKFLAENKFRLVVCLLLLFFSVHARAKLEQVSIQLKWHHSFQFAGYFAAIEKGFYRDEGLKVNLKEIDFAKDNVEQVISGDSEYGVSDSSLLLYHLTGKPVVLLKQFFQHSPLVFLSRRDSGIISPYEMVGKTVAFNNSNKGDAPLNTLLLNTLGDLSKIRKIDYDSSYFQQFIDGKIDVIFAYTTSEPFLLKERGIEVNIINPQNYGIDFYGDNFFTSQKELTQHPGRVARMVRATMKGWKYALEHPEQIIQLIRTKYNKALSIDHLRYAANTTWQMIIPELIELGTINPERYQRTAEEYLRLGFTKDSRIDGSFFYKPSVPGFSKIKLTLKQQAWLKQHPVIRLASEANWPPFEFIDETARLRGVSADIIRLIEERLGIQFRIVTNHDWAGTVAKIQNRDIDVASSVVKTPEREPFLNFTQAYLALPTVIITRKESPVIAGLDDLKNKIVAVENQYYLHKRLVKEFPEIKLLVVNNTIEALKAVAFGRANAYVGNQAAANWIIEQNALSNLKVAHDAGLGKAALRLAVRKDWPIFQNILDKAISAIPEEELLKINRKWLGLGAGSDKIKLSAPEQKWLNAHKNIRFTGDPNWLPYEAFDRQGNYIGIVAEHLKLIEKKLGITFNIVRPDSWQDAVEKIKQKEVDVLSETLDSELKSSLTFSNSYLTSPVVMVMKNDEDYVENLDQIRHKKIAVIKDYGYVPTIIKAYPDVKFHYVATIQDGLTAVSTGKLDALLATLAQASYHISDLGINNVRITGKTQFTTKVAFGIRPEYARLVPLLNRAIGSITQAEKQQILTKWGKQKFTSEIDYTLLGFLAAAFLLIVAAILFWNRRLAKEINKRKEMEAQTQVLIDNIPLQVVVTSSSGQILTANPKACAVHHINKEDIHNLNILDYYLNASDREAVLQEISKKGMIEEKIIPFIRPGGKIHSMMVSIIPIKYHNRRAYLSIGIDMTERLEMEAELQKAKDAAEAASRSKSQFLANMSHEIRTPMNAIIGFTELLNEQVTDPRLKSFVKTIQSAGNSLLLLINDILDLSKIEAGKMDIEKTAINPHYLFAELSDVFMVNVRKKGLDMAVEVAPEIPESLMLDAVRLRQVLVNILGNAVKFTEKGSIRLTAGVINVDKIRSKVDLIIEVEDTGIGIPEKQLQVIFEEFEQTEGQNFSKFGGTGLGLAISRRLVELMGGRISVQSEPGRGSKFTICLNNIDVGSVKQVMLPAKAEVPEIEFEPAVVMVVDDIENNRQLICENFSDTKVTVLQAENGKEAVAKAGQQQIDLILMDIRMPVMDGYQAAQTIKNQFNDLPIIALTASVMKDGHERVKSENFDGYLRKPVSRRELFNSMARFLDHHQLTKEKSQPFDISLSLAEQNVLPEVLKKLESMNEHWLVIQANNNISEIKQFSRDLIGIAEQYHFGPLFRYAEQLMEKISSFDVEGIKTLLESFSVFQENLQEALLANRKNMTS